MQDRYAGDMGDFGKIALLREFQRQGLSIGVNWYKVEPPGSELSSDGSFRRNDGRYMIREDFVKCDPALAETLLAITEEDRSVCAIEKADLVPGAKYYSETLTVDNRSKWHQEALDNLRTQDLVFLDPDNGMLVDSVGKGSQRSVKYVFHEEVCDYYHNERSILIYSHRQRKQEKQYFQEICETLEGCTGLPAEKILKITFPKGTIRDYLAIPANEEHRRKIMKAYENMANSIWGKSGLCRIPE